MKGGLELASDLSFPVVGHSVDGIDPRAKM